MKHLTLPAMALTLALLCLIVSCQETDFLDNTQTTDLNEQTVFADSTYATRFFFAMFENIGFDSDPGRFTDGNIFFPSTSGGLDGASDEAEPRVIPAITTDIQFATGTVNAVIVSRDAWDICYKNIRRANQFLAHLDVMPFNEGLKNQLAAETRFLRAWYYAILLKHYGGVPMVGDTVYNANDKIDATRNTYAECVDYIVSECDAAAALLPTKPTSRDYGRIGSGACKALKARVLLYAASPLFNGSQFAGSEPLNSIVGYPAYDAERWHKAAEAARAVIALNAYKLHFNNAPVPGEGFYEEFLAKDFQSTNGSEGIILERVATDSKRKEELWQPPSRGGGRAAYPYQELVDAFGMANGKPITDPASGYDPQNPYAGRDPRLNNTINHDQSLMPMVLLGPRVPIDIFLGSYQGRLAGQDAVHSGTPTGFYVNKLLHRVVLANSFVEGPASRPLMRYAETLLNFAEATNEYEGPTAEVYAVLEAIRERAGLSPFALPPGMSKEDMRDFIRNERRIELAFEGHRFFDVRRWMIAEETDNKNATGMEVTRNGDAISFKTFVVRKRTFRKAMYFWPIPYGETAKSSELLQNPYY
jgi:hypothetical protein